ncbi:hypothetical protein J6590_045163, partial [Homalodisca vitripennis]
GQASILDSVHRRFLRMVGMKLGFRYRVVDVQEIRRSLQIPTLATPRILMDMVFLQKLLICLIDCPEILRQD